MTDLNFMLSEYRRLDNDLWDSLPRAFIGVSGAILPAVFGPLLYATGNLDMGTAIAVALPLMGVGAWLSLPWFRAARSLGMHTKKMRAYTASMKAARLAVTPR